MSEKGWIYIASNPAMVGYLKIGMTQKTPELRLAELQTTGVPEPFKLEYSCLVAHALEVETAIHRHFDHYRSNANREFFNLAVSEVIEYIHDSFQVLHYEMADQEQTGFAPSNASSLLPSELTEAWVPQDWRRAYLETVTNLRDVQSNIARLKNEPCPEALVNPHPAPPVKVICGTPYAAEAEESAFEDWRHRNGEISDAEYKSILRERAERKDARARTRKREQESRRIEFAAWFSFEEKIKERDALRKQWNSRKSTLPTLKTRLEELELKLKKFTNPQRLSEFKRAYEARTSPEY